MIFLALWRLGFHNEINFPFPFINVSTPTHYLIIYTHKNLVHISAQAQGPAFESMLDIHISAVELYNNAYIL